MGNTCACYPAVSEHFFCEGDMIKHHLRLWYRPTLVSSPLQQLHKTAFYCIYIDGHFLLLWLPDIWTCYILIFGRNNLYRMVLMYPSPYDKSICGAFETTAEWEYLIVLLPGNSGLDISVSHIKASSISSITAITVVFCTYSSAMNSSLSLFLFLWWKSLWLCNATAHHTDQIW